MVKPYPRVCTWCCSNLFLFLKMPKTPLWQIQGKDLEQSSLEIWMVYQLCEALAIDLSYVHISTCVPSILCVTWKVSRSLKVAYYFKKLVKISPIFSSIVWIEFSISWYFFIVSGQNPVPFLPYPASQLAEIQETERPRTCLSNWTAHAIVRSVIGQLHLTGDYFAHIL